jgi:serine O-acetyltransferase
LQYQWRPRPNGIVIHPCALIGINCVIFQQVTRGDADHAKGPPIIEGHVYIGAGAKVLGTIVTGAHAKIGANAVVLSDVPPWMYLRVSARLLPILRSHGTSSDVK